MTLYDRYRPIHLARFGPAVNPPDVAWSAAGPRLAAHVRAWRPATRCRRRSALQLDLALRLLLAAVLGAVDRLEREVHDHPAGMRTHLLVSMGSAAFTVLSIEAFKAPGADPARVAAQIVTGIGFLGAGAILKEGATIRGLTTAASLWAVGRGGHGGRRRLMGVRA